ncbi:hypothetical protein [Algibacter lectus]|uniref:Uncharacterized protein n=1 Tax=Algibacter lectus TaxID=221126 RepID=A0A4R8MGJ2_9FLAO|nr:hypothetical protein [Algibacter lectus]MWW23682.1 hypothetical protein [Algibacter lectus]TDY63637.1 hypothetical protein DFQ06_0526 [Algibacter lectus]
MEEFLLTYKFLITTGVESLAAVTGLFLFKKYKSTAAKFFIYFLVYLTLCDFLANYPRYVKDGGLFSFLQGTVFVKNYWWGTLFWKIGAIMFFAFYYNRILKTTSFKKILKVSAFSFLLFSIGCILLNWDDYFIMSFPSISVFGAFIIFLCTVCYFIEVLKSDKILTFYKSLNFYISFAIFIWWLIITPIVFYDVYMSRLDWNFIFLRWQIYLIANITMYLTFTFALIWCKPEND